MALRYLFIIVMLNSFMFIGMFAVIEFNARIQKTKMEAYQGPLEAIDMEMSKGDYAAARILIDRHLSGTGIGPFEIELKGRKVICLTKEQRLHEAALVLNEVIGTYPFIADVNEKLFQPTKTAEDYTQLGFMIIDFGSSLAKSNSKPLTLSKFTSSFDAIDLLKIVFVNIFALVAYTRWQNRKAAKA